MRERGLGGQRAAGTCQRCISCCSASSWAAGKARPNDQSRQHQGSPFGSVVLGLSLSRKKAKASQVALWHCGLRGLWRRCCAAALLRCSYSYSTCYLLCLCAMRLGFFGLNPGEKEAKVKSIKNPPPSKMTRKPSTKNRAPPMCLSGQLALKVRLAGSSKRDGDDWAWVVNVAPRWSVSLCSCWCQEQDLLSSGIGLNVMFCNKPRGKPEDTRPTSTQSDAPGHLLLKPRALARMRPRPRMCVQPTQPQLLEQRSRPTPVHSRPACCLRQGAP